jgi:alkaline phosphatase D
MSRTDRINRINRVINRRTFIGGAAAATASLAWFRISNADAKLFGFPSLPSTPFTNGVASGDPTPEAVVIWTRLAPDPLDFHSMPDVDYPVSWEMATDLGFSDVVATGNAISTPDLGHSVKVDVTGLDPDSWYYYRFSAGGFDSIVGRTRTLPPAACTPDQLRFGFASCQSFPSGFYAPHDHLADEELDLVFFLGDFIYEGGGNGVGRAHVGPEIMTLDQYRNRYGQYRSDVQLQASQAAFPWVIIWDDHEVENNYAGIFDENGTDPATFLVRRANAYQAWWESQPVRLPPPVGPDLTIYRDMQWGELASFFALDTRQYRGNQPCAAGTISPPCPDQSDPNLQMLGTQQETWLHDGLRGSDTIWNVLANQMVMTSMPLFGSFNMDQWDGYLAARQRLFDVMGEPDVTNPVVITGDIHASGIAQLTADVDAPRVGTELVGTSISSTFPAALVDAAETVIGALEWVEFVDARHRGYVTVDLTPERLEATYRFVDDGSDPASAVFTGTTFTIESGATAGECVTETDDPPAAPPATNPAVLPARQPLAAEPASALTTTPDFTG